MQYVSRHSDEKVFHIDFTACNSYANGEAAAQAVTCPALFLLGKRDMMTPPKATATLTKAIAHAKTVLLDDCGHALMAEQPDAVLDNLFAFAKS
jgi:pimeloyl-ACP methyl ester carboxylesterase